MNREEEARLVAADLGLPVLGERNNPPGSPIKGFSWQEHVRLAMLSLVYGHMPFEHWWVVRDGRTHLAGVQERLPQTISQMDIGDDGQMERVWQNTQDNPIPAQNLQWYVNDREGANWAGTSLLRPCFTPWVLKHETMRVNATSIRRFGMGIPTVSAPPGATPAQIAEAQRLASGMRAGDETGAGLPDGFDFRLSGLIGAAPDALGFLEFCDQQITTSALAGVVELGHSAYGSRALGESFLDLFLLGLQAAADLIGEAATYGSPTMPGIARALVEYNWGEQEPIPRIVCTDVGDRHEITAAAIKMLVDAGALIPDPVLEEFLRDSWGLPSKYQSDQGPQPDGPGREEGIPTGPDDPPGPDDPTAPDAPAPDAGRPAPGRQGPAAARADARRRRRATGAAPFRRWRDVTAAEAAAGLDPDGLNDDLDRAAGELTARWAGVLRDQRHDLADQVAAAVDAGDLASLAEITAPPAGGPELMAEAMIDMAWTAARRAAGEVAHQRRWVDMARVQVDEDRLTRIAQARASLAGQQLALAASRRALRVVTATAGDDAAGEVQIALEGLSDAPLGDQFRAALSAAQNEGRGAAFEEADPDGEATYTASEINDANTCEPCAEVDQVVFASLEEAQEAYANGGYIDCLGELRCRGTFIQSWPDIDVTPGDGGPEPEGPAGPREDLGSWDAGLLGELDGLVPDGGYLDGDQAAGDRALARIRAEQGMNGLPERGNLDQAEAEGGQRIWRGNAEAAHRDDWLTNPDARVGFGIYGNGDYFAGNLGGARSWHPDMTNMIEGVLKRDARTVEYRQLQTMMGRSGDNVLNWSGNGQAVLADGGRYAAALGYDAITLHSRDGALQEIVVLNRAAVIVP